MKQNLIIITTLSFLFIACTKETQNGKNSLIDLIAEPAGENCSSGGYKIISGIDLDENNTLDENEIQNTKYICNGKNSLIDIIPEPAGENCYFGGNKIISGIDFNQNNVLDENEIQNIEYVCNNSSDIFDKQVRLTIVDFGEYTALGNEGSTSGVLVGNLSKFNKHDWIGVDSIIFITSIYTENSTSKAFAELYDITNNTAIENSTVSTNSTKLMTLESGNIFNFLPEDEIDLSVRFRSEKSSTNTIISSRSYLILYRTKQ